MSDVFLLADKRRAVAEWRDDHILAALASINRCINTVKARLDADFRDATAKDVFFPETLASKRIDSLTQSELAPALTTLLDQAATDLQAIDPRLTSYADGLRTLDLSKYMAVPALNDSDLDPPQDDNSVPAKDGDLAKPGIAVIGEKIRKGASALAETAGAARDNLVSEKLGLSERIRTTAIRRVFTEWRDDTNPSSVLSIIVLAIDEVAASSRIALL